jgi:hypothetical protein
MTFEQPWRLNLVKEMGLFDKVPGRPSNNENEIAERQLANNFSAKLNH